MATTIKNSFKSMYSSLRASETCKKNGVDISFKKVLLKITNTKFRGTMLSDGTCHYQNQWTVSGNTFQIKEILKQHGFSWDASNRRWFRKADEEARKVVVILRKDICRALDS